MSIVIITGASSGMGYEMALQLDRVFQKTDEFWLIGRNTDKLLEIKNRIRNNSKIFSMDFTVPSSFEQFEDILKIEKPRVRFLVNAAGFGYMGEAAEIPVKSQTEMVRVNCEGLTRMTLMVLPYMVRNTRIIQFASSAAFIPQPSFAVYAATKSYVLSFSNALSEELRKKHIYVTSVCPGPVDTCFFARAEKFGKTLDIKDKFMSYPEDVVNLAIRDSYKKKRVSIYSLPMKLFYLASETTPTFFFLIGMRFLKFMERIARK